MRGRLTHLFIGATVGVAAVTYSLSDQIGQAIVDHQHEPVQRMNGGESLQSVFSPMRAGGSEDPDAKAGTYGSLSDTENSEQADAERIHYVMEGYESQVVEVFKNPDALEIDKFNALRMFYEGLSNPEDTAHIPGFRSHAEFIQHIRNQTIVAVKSLQTEIEQNPHESVDNYYRSKDILSSYQYAGYNGRLTEKEMEEGKEHDEFDYTYADQITGIDPAQWDAYLKPLSLLMAKSALDDFRVGYSAAPKETEQGHKNLVLVAELQRLIHEVGGNPETLIGVTAREIDIIHTLRGLKSSDQTPTVPVASNRLIP